MYFAPTHLLRVLPCRTVRNFLLTANQLFTRPLPVPWSTFVIFQVPASMRLSASTSLPVRWNLCLSTLGLARRDNRLLTALMDSEVRPSH